MTCSWKRVASPPVPWRARRSGARAPRTRTQGDRCRPARSAGPARWAPQTLPAPRVHQARHPRRAARERRAEVARRHRHRRQEAQRQRPPEGRPCPRTGRPGGDRHARRAADVRQHLGLRPIADGRGCAPVGGAGRVHRDADDGAGGLLGLGFVLIGGARRRRVGNAAIVGMWRAFTTHAWAGSLAGRAARAIGSPL